MRRIKLNPNNTLNHALNVSEFVENLTTCIFVFFISLGAKKRQKHLERIKSQKSLLLSKSDYSRWIHALLLLLLLLSRINSGRTVRLGLRFLCNTKQQSLYASSTHSNIPVV